jgi:hypothetical protein
MSDMTFVDDAVEDGDFPLVSPRPSKTTLTFIEALQEIQNGRLVTKLQWDNDRFFCGLQGDRLQLHKPDGVWSDWVITTGDMNGDDWVIYDPAVHTP